ncbi:MAG: lysylphosphatidylglycerol synthase domain-containing protein [Crocinitomicaceae bacterium]
MSKTTQNIAIHLLKVLFFAVCGIYIYEKVVLDGFEFSYFLTPFDFTIFTILMLLNWFIEALKWKYLIREVEEIRVSNAIKSTLAGLSFGLLTPNRMGNFIGKILYLKPENRIKGTLYAFYGNFSQMLTTFLFGSLCFFWTFENYYSSMHVSLAILPFLFSMVMTFLFLHPEKLQFKWIAKVFSAEVSEVIHGLYAFQSKHKVLFYAALRHLVYTIQYLIVLSYSPNFDFIPVLLGIQMIFFLTTMIPSLVFGKMMVRGPVALFVMATLGYSTSFVLNAILFIWLINIALPSLLGSFLFMVKKRG